MREKRCAFLMAVLLALYGTTIFAAESPSRLGEISGENTIDMMDNVLVISRDSLSSDLHCDTDHNAFLENKGIIVVLQDRKETISLDKKLNIPFSFEEADKSSDNMIKIATLYYRYLGAAGIRDIYIEDVDESEYEVLIAKEVSTVRTKIENQAKDVISDEVADAATYIGEYTSSYIYKPKMKIEAGYGFYTIQDYVDGKDYYIVLGDIIGNSGRAMTDLNESGYKSKYETDNLIVTVESQTMGFTREEFAPGRTVGSDTEIGLLSHPTKTIWTVKYIDGKDSQKKTSEFHPAISMSCSESTDSVQMCINTSYQVDAWNTLPVSRNFSTIITLYPD